MKQFVRVLTASLFAFLSLNLSTKIFVSAAEKAPLSMCRDAQGNVLAGEVDFLLLLDNSKSLNQRDGSDTKNRRYQAIEEMLTSVVTGIGSSNKVNFALSSFGSQVRDAIPFESIPLSTESDVQSATAEIMEKVPGEYKKQESTTNYIKALDHASKLFDSRPSQNCKILVWFTDGVYESRETRNRSEWRKQASELKTAVCGRIASSFQNSRINTFALVLEPKNPDGSRLSASYGAMAALTGDTDLPSNVKKAIKAGDDCGGGVVHLGEVLLASDASAIGRFMPGIANIASGAEQATQECPVSTDESESLPLPAARYLQWIAIENIERDELPNLDQITLETNVGNAGKLSDFLTQLPKNSQYELKFKFTEEAKKSLDSGWQIKVSNGLKGLCVRAKAETFALKFSEDSVSKQSTVIAVDKKSKVIEEDSAELRFARADDVTGNTYSLQEAASIQDDVVALLQIDETKKIFEKPLQIRVLRKDSATNSCSQGLSFAPWRGTMPKNRVVTTESCRVNVEGTQQTIERIEIDYAQQRPELEKCGIVLSPSVQTPKDKTPVKGSSGSVSLSEGSSVDFQIVADLGAQAKCKIEQVKVKVTFLSKGGASPSQDIPLAIEFDLKKAPNLWLTILLTLSGVVAVTLLNLFGLNVLMRRLVRMPSPNELRAVELPLVLSRTPSGGVDATVNGTPLTTYVVGQQDLLNVQVSEGDALQVSKSGTVLRMKRPSFWKPLKSPLVVIDPEAPAVYSPNAGDLGGLAPTFKSAIVFHSAGLVGDSAVRGILTVLVPMSGRDGGARGVESLLKNQTKVREITTRGIDVGSSGVANVSSQSMAAKSGVEPTPSQETPIQRLPRIPGQSKD